jgi:lipopolysaccharide export system permease protein
LREPHSEIEIDSVNLLDRYIGGAVARSVLYALLALVSIFSMISLMEELRDVGDGGYDAAGALWFVIMMLPTQAYELFPSAALLGSVMGLGHLASHHELIAMQATGVSRARLIGSVLQMAALLIVAVIMLGELVAAPLSQRAQTNRSVAMSGGMALTTPNGVWARNGKRFVNARQTLPDGSLRDIYVYDFDEQRRLRVFTYAKSASYADSQWSMKDLVESVMTEDGGVKTERIGTRTWDSFLSPRQLRVLSVLPQNLSLSDLHRSILSLRTRGQSELRHQLAYWRRIGTPLLTGIMVYLAVPFVLNMGPRATTGKRIVAAVLVGLGFRMFSDTFSSFGLVYGMNPIVTALLPAIAVLTLGLAWTVRRPAN